MLVDMSGNNVIKEFCDSYFTRLDELEIKYAIFGNYHSLPEFVENDIDIWISNYQDAYLELCAVFKSLNVEITCENITSNGCNIYGYKITNGTIQYLHIDLLIETAWKSWLPIIDSSDISKNVTKYKNYSVVNESIETVGHLLYPFLNKSIFKEKYRKKLSDNISNEKSKELIIAKIGAKNYYKIKNNIEINNFDSMGLSKKDLILSIIKNNVKSQPLKLLKNINKFFVNNLTRIFKPTGINIAFIGNDGCGKSTVVNRLINDSKKLYNGNNSHNHYWRPFILPRISKVISSTSLDSSNFTSEVKKHSKLKSYVKLAYYSLDYIFGGIKDYLLKSRGGIIIYDRYFDDLLVYPERFGMTLNSKITTLIRTFIPQPDLIIYLSAPIEVLKNRRYEIFDSEMERQIAGYLNLCNSKANVIEVNGDQSIDEVYFSVLKELSNYGK